MPAWAQQLTGLIADRPMLRDSKSIAVLRAIAERAIIVAGILLALAAEAVWEARQAAAREKVYLTALKRV